MSADVHYARPLTVEERHATYADALSFYGMRHRLRHTFNWGGVVFGALGLVCVTASVIGWLIMLPLKTVEVRFIVVNEATGEMTYSVRADEASELFGPKQAEHYLQQYVQMREGFLPALDKRHFDVVQEMSSAEVFGEYTAWRKSDLSPVKQLGTAGHVNITDIDFSPHGKADNGTYEYTVRYRRQEVRDDARGPVKPFSTVIAFSWNPKAKQSVQEGRDNPGGMLVVGYSVPRPD